MGDDKTQIRELKDLIGGGEKTNERQAYLIVIAGSEIGRMYRLQDGRTVIGRSRGAQMVVEDAGVSRNHVEVMETDGGALKIRDCGSTNGSLLNGTPLSSDFVDLKDGDKIQVGTAVLLKFSYQDHLDENFQQHLYSSAVRDSLTGAYNKRYLMERLEQEYAYSKRHDVPYSLVIFDLDHFKRINDTRGHPCGDYVLQTIAGVIQKRMRKEEVFARYGGEEFVVLLRETDLSHAVIFAERIRRLIEACRLEWEGSEFSVTVSVGVSSTSSADFPSAEALFARADELLYQAKRGGRNRVCYDG